MCSIFGGVGPSAKFQPHIVEKLREAAKDRGRDGGRVEYYDSPLYGGISAALGNWRAIPTPELAKGKLQPYNAMVHNGTIANDVELGKREGEIDSEVLSRVIERENDVRLSVSLEKVKGSWALAAWNGETVLLSTNYKPIYYAQIDGAFYFSSMKRHFHRVLDRGQAPVAVEPYTCMDLLTGGNVALKMATSKKALVICSAGLDSTVAATSLVRLGYDVTLLHFLYGCRAQGQEVSKIPQIATALGCNFRFMQVDYGFAKNASTLLRPDAPIAEGFAGAEYAHEWVPARNLMFMALAAAAAEAGGFHSLAIGINLEEAGAFPDNEEEFTVRFNELLPYAVQNGYDLKLLTPVGNLMKHEIVKLGLELRAPLELTWSCYKNGAKHCGHCGPCAMRREAFKRNGLVDPVFADAELQRSAEAALEEGLADNGVLLDDVIGDSIYGADD